LQENQTAEEFVKDLEAAKNEIHKLQQSNIDKVKALGTYGKAVDPAVLAHLKIDTFIETFLDEGAQVVYLRNLEVKIREMLDGALKESRQQSLIIPRG
jgi:hypothetical protein